MKMKKQLFVVMMAYFLVFQTILAPISATTAFATGNDEEVEVEEREALESEAEEAEKELIKDIIKDIYFTDKNEKKVDVGTHEGEVIAHVEWSAQNIENLPEYEEEFSLPEQIKLYESTGDLKSGDVKFAKYKANNNGKVNIEFNEDLVALEEIEGVFKFTGEIEVEEVAEEKEEVTEEKSVEKKETQEKDKADKSSVDKKETAKKKDEEEMENAKLAEEEESSSSKIKNIEENLITDVNLTLKKQDGTDVKLNPGDPIVVDPDDPFKILLDYAFEIPNNHAYGEGSKFTIELPELFSADDDNVVPRELIHNGQVLGTYIVENNEIVITFTDAVAELSNIKGNIFLETEFAKHYEGSAENQEIEFPIRDEESLKFPVEFIPKGSAIDKQGVPYKDGEAQGDQGYNTDEILWTVDFNKSLEKIDNAFLQDETTGKHTFKDGTLKVYEIHMNVDGTIDESKTEEIVDHGFGDAFPLNLGDIDSAYRVQYITEIDEEDVGTIYKNKATLQGDDMDSLEAEATVSVGRGERLEKGAVDYNPSQHTITWEIKYNYDEKEIENAKLTDTFIGDQKLNADSFEVYEIELDSSTGNEVGDGKLVTDIYTREDKADGFVLSFDETITKAYKIKYKTTIDERIDDWTQIKNKVEDEEDNEDEGSQDIGQEILHKSNNSDQTDYDEKTTSWTVGINYDEHVMNDVTVVDTLPKGFTPKDIAITHGENAYVEGEDYTYEFDETTRELTIKFTESISKKVVITYVTDIDHNETDPEESGNFKNKVNVEWTPEGSDDSIDKEGEAEFNPDENTRKNGFKNASYNYEAKEITWNIGVNYNKLTLEDVVVEDIILGNQNFDIDSVKVHEMNLTGGWNGADKGDELAKSEYELIEVDGPNGEPGFKVELGDIEKPYYITYKTDLEGLLIENKYDNTAVVKSSNKEDIELDASVSVNSGGEYTSKTFNQTGRVVKWEAKINSTQSTVKDASITDTPSENLMVLKDTIKLYDTHVNNGWPYKKDVLEEGTDYELEFNENEDGLETFTITFTENPITSAYVLEYDTYIMHAGEDDKFSNNLIFEGKGTEELETDTSTGGNINFSNIDGNIEGELGSLEITKVDAGDGSKLAGAEFTLYDKTGEIELQKGVTNEEGIITFDKLLHGDYMIKETGAPEGYEVSVEDKETVTVDADPTAKKIENRKTGTIDIAGKKTWAGDENATENRPGSITVNLLANDEVIDSQEVTANADGKWNYSFVNLPEQDEDGEKIVYTIEEETVDGYTSEVDDYDITNTLIPTIDIAGEKIWDEQDAQYRPGSIIVELKANGEVIESQEVIGNDDEKWTFEFSDLDKYDEDKKEIVYTINEVETDGYTSEVDGYTITNTQETTEISGEKTWLDNDDATDDRPESITVQVKNETDDKPVQTTEVEADKNGEWNYTFTDLPKFDKEGNEINYTVAEANVPKEYAATVKGNNITNVRVGETEVTVNKTWEDEDESDRPESITVNLLQNGTTFETEEIKADENGNWSHTFKELPEFDETGKAYEYTVTEQDVPGYDSEVDGFEITNTRADEKSIEITKAWLDDNSEERPESIDVELFRSIADGEKESVDIYQVKASDDWSLEVTDLPAFDSNGKAYTYEIEEKAVKGYESTVNGFDITNLLAGKTEVSGEKKWADKYAQYRPDSIIVNLHANGDEEAIASQEVTVNDDEKWTFEFSDLDQFDSEGKEIVYTVKEEFVVGYTTKIDGYTITNTQETTEISGEKTWLDNDDATDDRPESITVQVKNETDDKPVQTTEVEADKNGKWNYTFTDLPKFDKEGNEINYTVAEANVPEEYAATVKGNNITNVRVGETEVTVNKTWEDEDESDRPESITVNLLQNGTTFETEEIKADENGNWSHTFKELPEFDEIGKAYEYTVTEQDVPGYDSKVDGFEITNTRADKKSIEITKAWLDDNSEKRPDSIEVELFRSIADGEKESVDIYQVKASDDWSLEVTDLPAFDSNGKAYTYEIEEKAVKGYESTVNGFDITNLRVGDPEISGTKTWENDDENMRPKSITVKLLANNVEIDSQEVTAESNWEYTFANLPEFDDQGKKITYTVDEVAVNGYETIVDGFDITNTFIEEDPEDPKDPEDPAVPKDPQDPKDPTEPTDPKGPADSDKPGDSTELGTGDSSGKPGEGLPKTASNMYNLIVIGLLMVLAGAGLYMVRRIRTN